MKRFYTELIIDNVCYLQHTEAAHCAKVLRCKVGEQIECMNGIGNLWLGKIASIQKHDVVVDLEKMLETQSENRNKLSIAISNVKNPARLEWFVEKATEIGVDEIFPIIAERTEKESLKIDRLQNIIISAAKQSKQLFFPKLHPIIALKSAWARFDFPNQYIAHCNDEKQHFANVYPKMEKALLLIGPEGDFTKDEVSEAINKNFHPVSLGSSILRVETAGIYACSVVSALNEI